VPPSDRSSFQHLKQAYGASETVEVLDVEIKAQIFTLSLCRYRWPTPIVAFVRILARNLCLLFLAAKDIEEDGRPK
jgi:hypothetical protein